MNVFEENWITIKNKEWGLILTLSKNMGYKPEDLLTYFICETISRWDHSSQPIYKIGKSDGKSMLYQVHCNCDSQSSWKMRLAEQKITEILPECEDKMPKALIIFTSEIEKQKNAKHVIKIEILSDKAKIMWQTATTADRDMFQNIEDFFLEFMRTCILEEKECVPFLWLPAAQREKRNAINHTLVPRKAATLHEDFIQMAAEKPNAVALISNKCANGHITYQELHEMSLCAANQLQIAGVKEGDAVAVTMHKSHWQIVAVLAILYLGAYYVPIGLKHPEHRRNAMCREANIKYILSSTESLSDFSIEASVKILDISESCAIKPFESPITSKPNSTAYVIFTSGTTGEPKGVCISHQAAKNTIADILERFSFTSKDRGIGISELDFDLSVFDIFGFLSVGASIVVLSEETKLEASTWVKNIQRYGITVWNSVPALFEMLLLATGRDDALDSLRLALLSGDWVRPKLYHLIREKNKACKFVALGGATEASIWSNFYEVYETHKSWTSIPYGRPLSNQRFRVVDQWGRDCPNGVPGELYIGGKGVADGYLNQPALTAEKFVEYSGQKWYRTGDLGKYWEDGMIEFLGRLDNQVKIKGFRIELDEISRALESCNGIDKAVAVKVGSEERPYIASVATTKRPLYKVQQVDCRLNQDEASVQRALSTQNAVVSYLIISLLQLDNHFQDYPSIDIETLYQQNDITKSMRNVVCFWLRWLQNLEILTLDGEKIMPASKYEAAIKKEIPIEARGLLQKQTLLKEILSGRESPLSILQDEALSPERMSSSEEGTLKGIKLIVHKLNQIPKVKGRPLNVAMIGVRTGIIAKKLLSQLPEDAYKWTLHEQNKTLIEQAKAQLASNNQSYTFSSFSEESVPNTMRKQFDVVIAVNALHTYLDLDQSMYVITSLLNDNGVAYSLDFREIPPLSLITAAILEEGFIKFSQEHRPNKHNPMLTGVEWCQLFQKGGFSDTQYWPVHGTLLELVEAKNPAHSSCTTEETIFEELSQILPEYMLPEEVKFIYKMPLNKNGKVNTNAITSLFARKQKIVSIAQPKTKREEEVADIWKKVINLTDIGREQSFFEIGGDSLLATQFISIVKEKYAIEISMKEMFDQPSLAAIAKNIDDKLQKIVIEESEIEYGEI